MHRAERRAMFHDVPLDRIRERSERDGTDLYRDMCLMAMCCRDPMVADGSIVHCLDVAPIIFPKRCSETMNALIIAAKCINRGAHYG